MDLTCNKCGMVANINDLIKWKRIGENSSKKYFFYSLTQGIFTNFEIS